MEEKQFSAKKLGLVFCAVVFIVIVVLLTVFSCNIQKKDDVATKTSTTSEVDLVDSTTQDTQKGVNDRKEVVASDSSSVKEDTASAKNTEVVSKPVTATADNTPVDKNVVAAQNDSAKPVEANSDLVKFDGDVDGTTYEVNCAVSGKSVYTFGGNYVFSVNILVPLSVGGYSSVNYFCNKNTYDAVSFGDLLKVTYIESAKGEIGVISVSKQ